MTGLDLIKRLLFAAAILFSAISARASAPAPLTTIHLLETVTNTEASKHLPVSFQATVTYFRGYDKDLFLQDGHDAVYVHATTNLKLAPGDRVLVRGTTHGSFRPFVESDDITLVGHGPLPEPEKPTFEQMIRAETDCRFVTVRAIVRSADLVPNTLAPRPTAYLRMLVDGAPADANIDTDDVNTLKGLLDAEVQITGPVSGHFDNKMQQTGILFHIQSLDGVKMLKPAGSDPWSLPITPMNVVIAGFRSSDRSQRMRVQGTITYYQPGSALVLQDGSKSLWVETRDYSPLQVGDRATAIGFPDVQNGILALTRSEIQDSLVQKPVIAPLLTWRELALGGNTATGHSFDLVSIEGEVVADVRQATEDAYVLKSDGRLFSAIMRHPSSLMGVPLFPMKDVPQGARIRVTGICILTDANPFNGEVPFNILLRSPGDILVVANPSELNSHNAALVVAWLLIAVLAIGMRGWYLEHRTRRQIGSLAYVEQRRGRILEDINHSKPLAGILERITELVSVRLNGAPCWCQIAGGAKLGNCPAQLDSSLRTVEHPIAARSGPALGSIFTALDARTKACALETEALSMAAELATLAIETSRLYSDLVHRSEYDLLTDVHNRFAMEKALRAQIHAVRQSASIFGMIYIDLNEFKQVNDVYGHQAGDLYLQELTQRMKDQLRPGDSLARLGGDEFAVLVSQVRNRAEVEEIAARLERCFDEPFKGEGYALHGSASIGIALYPEDANSADSLLRAADAAMYSAKYTRSGKSRSPKAQSEIDLTAKN